MSFKLYLACPVDPTFSSPLNTYYILKQSYWVNAWVVSQVVSKSAVFRLRLGLGLDWGLGLGLGLGLALGLGIDR